MSCKDSTKEPLNDTYDPLVKEEKLFKRAVQDMNTVFEIGLAVRRSMVGALGGGGPARIELDVRPISEEPIQGDQNEMGKDFLFHTAFGPAVKVLDDEDAFAHLVKLLDAPSAMVDVDELLERVTMRIEQRGAQAKYTVGNFVFEQSHFQRDDLQIGVL
jgi:hypothetical protein